jgi:hypothetical protein
MRSFPWRYPGLAAVLVALAFLAGDRRAPCRPTPSRAEDLGPSSLLVEAGSVEARLRAMEAQLVELRAELERLSARSGSDISLPR